MNPAVNAKAIAGAICVLIVVICRKYWPDIASDGAVQEAIRVLLEVAVSAALVWAVPNKQLTPAPTPDTATLDPVNDPKNYRS